MFNNAVMFIFPFAMDIIVGLILFVGRHSLASRGFDENAVGAISFVYGIGYITFGLLMRFIVRADIAKLLAIIAIGLTATFCCALAFFDKLWMILLVFLLIPFATNLFFNSFQAMMLHVSNENRKPLVATAGHYTFAWSFGFALGPLLSSQMKTFTTWSNTYFLASGISLLIAILLIYYKPQLKSIDKKEVLPPKVKQTSKGYPGIAWMGTLIGWVGWIIISTYWPIQSSQHGYSPMVKGMIETLFASSQAFMSLVLIFFPSRFFKAPYLLLFGIIGALGVFTFGIADSILIYSLGVILFGIFTSNVMTSMIYHSMIEPDKAIKRVAINEIFMGISFTVGPLLATLLHRGSKSFVNTYILLSTFILIGITLQTILFSLAKKRNQNRTMTLLE